jgi:hypothetical protein
VQLEPPPAEQWRSDADALLFARDHAVGWTCDVVAQTDYCPQHTDVDATRTADAVAPRATATVRDQAGNPLDRDEYAEHLRALLAAGGRSTGDSPEATPEATGAQISVAVRLLHELAGVYRGESLGALAHDLAVLLDSQFPNQD